MAAVPDLPAILLTGFEPFDGDDRNPSQAIVQALAGHAIAGHRIVGHELPVAFGDSLRVLRQALRRTRPALVVCLGQAGGRDAISLERVAINVDDARIADNAGARPVDRPVIARGPAAYFSTLPITAMTAAVAAAGIPAAVSQTAGTFVCNHVFYGLMHALRRRPGVRGGFIHVPWLESQAIARPGEPAMALATMVRGVEDAPTAREAPFSSPSRTSCKLFAPSTWV